jgi:hypothetical protein
MNTTCKCGTPLIDSDDGICEKCFIHQVYEMGRPGPRWQTLAEARPGEGQQVCVDAADGRSVAAHVAPTGEHWVIYSDPRRLFLLNMSPTDRWHPWPGKGKN